MYTVAYFVALRIGNKTFIPVTTLGSHPIGVIFTNRNTEPYVRFEDDVDNYVKTSYPDNYENKTYSAAIYSKKVATTFRLPSNVDTKSAGFSPVAGWRVVKTYFPNRSDPNDR